MCQLNFVNSGIMNKYLTYKPLIDKLLEGFGDNLKAGNTGKETPYSASGIVWFLWPGKSYCIK